MKKVLLIFAIITFWGSAHAECPSGWEDIPMENFTITESGGSCAAGTTAYYHIDTQCNANVL